MTQRPVSIIVVSRHRPDALMLCLTGIAQLFYDTFEVIVVTDSYSATAVADRNLLVKLITFDEANISKARNLGLAQAAGEVVAFIDDDAVPEPTWLNHLIAPFADARLISAGGFVRARNGISFQWKGRQIDASGAETPLPLGGDDPQIFETHAGFGVKTEGTNCAFRRDALAEMGGFDPAFQFYLDETDVNMRLAHQGCQAALVPLAQVHHGFAESQLRKANRAPIDLTQIGASVAVFHRKYPHPGGAQAVLDQQLVAQHARLIGLMIEGRIEPGEIAPLLASFRAGWEAGCARPLGDLTAIPKAAAPFLPFCKKPKKTSVHLAGRIWQATTLRRRAEQLVAQGQVVTLFLFSPTAGAHRVKYDPGGYWLHTGGLFGRSKRTDPFLRWSKFNPRVTREWNLVKEQRMIGSM